MVVKPISAMAFSVFSLTNSSRDLNSLLSGTATSEQNLLQLRMAPDYDYVGKAYLRKGHWNPKRKLGVIPHIFLIIN